MRRGRIFARASLLVLSTVLQPPGEMVFGDTGLETSRVVGPIECILFR
jgi:hypothetical protein